MRRLLLIASLLILPVAAQEKLVESIEVHVVNVDVVVTDRAGNPVHGLTRDDFELFENGVPQKISNFYEERPSPLAPLPPSGARGTEETAAPPPARERRIVIFIDDYSVDPHKRTKVIEGLQKFIDNEMREGDSASIVSWARRAHVLVQFTSDKSALKTALKTIGSSGGSIKTSMDDRMVRNHCLEMARIGGRGRAQAASECLAAINARADEQWALERDLLQSMRLTMASMAGIEGKKVMVIAGAHLPETPALDLYQFFQQLFGGGLMTARMQGSHRSQTISIEGLARAANADGVTLYLIDTADQRDAFSADVVEQIGGEEAFMKFTNTAMAYKTLAKITGGVAITDTNNFDTAFQTVARDLSSYYSLGYRPLDEKSTGNRKLSVKAKNSAYQVRSRETFALKTGDEQMADRVLANIYHEGLKNEWPIELRAGTPQKDGRNYRVPIEVTVPSTVTLLPAEENKLAGGFDVYIAVGNEDGDMSGVTKRTEPIRIPAAVEKVIRAKPLVFNAVLMVRPGQSTISIGVIDEVSGTQGFARTKIVTR